MTPETATARLPRLLTLVPWLVNRQGIDMDSAASELEISIEQLRSDLELLFMCGYGSMTDELIDVQTEDGRIFISNADTIRRPLRLDRAEALTLMVGLRALAGSEGLTDSDVVERTLAKLEVAAGAAADTGGVVVEATLDDGSSETTRALVREALARRRRIHLRYFVPGRDESTERDVDPMRILGLDGRWYLEGWCHRAEDTRLFRLDRVEHVEVLDADGTPPASAAHRDLDAGTFRPSADDVAVTLSLGRGWEWVAEYYPIDERLLAPDGTLHVTLRVSDSAWLKRLIWRSGGGIVVTVPAPIAAEVRAGALSALTAYGLGETDGTPG